MGKDEALGVEMEKMLEGGDTKSADREDAKNAGEYQIEGVVKEWRAHWTTHKNVFSYKTFFVGLVLSALNCYDFVAENQLGWEYILGSEKIYHTDNITSVPDECKLLQNNSTFISDAYQHLQNTSSSHNVFTYSCRTEGNVLLGAITLAIPFLPGIQWYASVKTKKHQFGKFVTSLLFPFFMIFFKVRKGRSLYYKFKVSHSGKGAKNLCE